MADDAFRSLSAGRLIPAGSPTTIADGLRTSLGDKTFAILQRLVDRIDLASEAGIGQATELLLTRLKLVVEPSAAVPLAAILENGPAYSGRRVGLILSGGNLDLAVWPRLQEQFAATSVEGSSAPPGEQRSRGAYR